MSNEDNNYKILIGLADTDNHKKYNCIRYKEVGQDLYVLTPFEYKDQMKAYCSAENIWGSWSGSEKAWKYPINAKSKIFSKLEELFKADSKQKSYINFNATNQPNSDPAVSNQPTTSKKAEPVKSKPTRQTQNQPMTITTPTTPTTASIPSKPNLVSDQELAQQEANALQTEIVEPEDYPQLPNNTVQTTTNSNYALEQHKKRVAGLTTQNTGMLSLVGSVDDLVSAWKEFRRLDTELLDESDYHEYGSGKNRKKSKNKSAFRKYATAFGVSCEVLGEPIIIQTWDIETNRPLDYIAKFHVLAYPFNSPAKYQDGWGVADGREKCLYDDKEYWDRSVQPWQKKIKPKCPPDCDWRKHWNHWRHDIEALAHTRAKNRAISDLVGSGEVSYEELASPNLSEDEES